MYTGGGCFLWPTQLIGDISLYRAFCSFVGPDSETGPTASLSMKCWSTLSPMPQLLIISGSIVDCAAFATVANTLCECFGVNVGGLIEFCVADSRIQAKAADHLVDSRLMGSGDVGSARSGWYVSQSAVQPPAEPPFRMIFSGSMFHAFALCHHRFVYMVLD
eukprot:SAG31_NODE_1157_length_9612_cov_6.630401_6_plen_162_part_00